MITIEDFKKLEIKIGKIQSAEKLLGTDKLLKLIIDFGDHKRQILTGIAEYIPDPTKLVNKEIPVLVNLEPRKFKGEISEGMIIAADLNGKPVLLHPEYEIPAGSPVI